MMRQRLAILTVVLTAGACLLLAEFWDDRAFTEWNDNQVQRILENSPWAQSTPVTLKGDAKGGSGGGGGGGRGMSIVSFGFQGRGGGGGGLAPEPPRPTLAVVRWDSALPVRQALARQQFGAEAGTSPQAIEYLGRNPSSYVIHIVGIPAGGDLGTQESLMAGAQLVPRNREPIPAMQAVVERGRRGVDLFLAFPRQTTDGAPLLTVEDRQVQLVLDAPTIEMRRRFNLNDMVFQGKLEL